MHAGAAIQPPKQLCPKLCGAGGNREGSGFSTHALLGMPLLEVSAP